jgi:hypothetical protein
MRGRPAVVLVIVLGLVVGPSMAAGGSGAAVSAGSVAQTEEFALAATQPEPDNTVTRIHLQADGSATWELTLRTRLATAAERSEFEQFQESFRANTSRYLGPFEQRMSGVVAQANETSQRRMAATNFSANTTIQEVPQRWGIVTFRFDWAGFAAVESDRLIVGDVFDSGFYISADDVLAVQAPPSYAIREADPAPDDAGDGFVEWQGREDFADQRPRVVAVPEQAATTQSASGGFGPLLLGGLLGIGVLLLVGYGFYTGAIGGSTEPDGDEPPAAGTAGTGRKATTDDSTASEPDHELLTDEDRVRRALQAEGGRMKQSAIVAELDWSKSKTSRVLSQMEEGGEIEKLRIGRENVIDLVED